MSSQDPNLGLTYGFVLGFSTWNAEMNANMKKLGALVNLAVLGVEENTPPGAPVNGDRWITGDAPTGAWAGHADQVAVYIGSAWEFYTPEIGWTAYNITDTNWYIYMGDTGARWAVYAVFLST